MLSAKTAAILSKPHCDNRLCYDWTPLYHFAVYCHMFVRNTLTEIKMNLRYIYCEVPCTMWTKYQWFVKFDILFYWNRCRKFEFFVFPLPSKHIYVYPSPFIHSMYVYILISLHVNSLRIDQNGWRFADNIVRLVIFKENFCILIKISLVCSLIIPLTIIHHWVR